MVPHVVLSLVAFLGAQNPGLTPGTAEVNEREVQIVHVPDAPSFAGTLTTPAGPGPHPAALLVSPAGEHPRDELRRGGRHWADLAARLAARGIASLRVDNRGVGGSRHEAWPEWSWSISIDELAEDTARHVTWLRQQPGIDGNRVGVIAHGDGTVPTARMVAAHKPAFAILLSASGARGLEDIVRRQAARLPEELPADRRDAIAAELTGALERIVEVGATDETRALVRGCLESLGIPAEKSADQAAAFVETFGSRWYRDYLGHRPTETFASITSPILVVLVADDPRLDAAASEATIRQTFRDNAAFNSSVQGVSAGGHFCEPGDGRLVLRDDVVQRMLRFLTDATGFLPNVEMPSGAPASGPVVFENVTVVDVAAGDLREGRIVIVEKGIITRVAAAPVASRPAGSKVIDAAGKFLIPGLWDGHVHLSMWGPDALSRAVAYGVTTVRDMGGDWPRLRKWREAIESGRWLGPRLLLAGPFLDGEKPNDQYRRFLRTPSEVTPAVAELKGAGVDFLKVHSRLPPDVLRELARVAPEQGIAFCGHIPAGVTPWEASELGLRSIEHADSFFSALVRAQPSPVTGGWPEARTWWKGEAGKKALETIAAEGTFVVPTLTPIAEFAERMGGLFAVVAPWTREITKTLHDTGIPIAAGTDFARSLLGIEPGRSLHGELALLVEAGLSPAEALRAATLNAARMMGVETELGEIAVGQSADLVLLRKNPLVDIANTRAIEGVLLRGAWLPRPQLESTLERMQVARDQ